MFDSTPNPASADRRRRFQFRDCLGSGGFGDVYRATMISPGGLKRDVAVKILHVGTIDALRRLRDEGKLLAALDHPSILRVHDLAGVGGRVALVTEFVDGDDFSTLVQPGPDPLPPRAVIEVTAVVGEALDAAYNKVPVDTERPLRLVHRDIKPSNVRLGRHGQVKLLDFGIAFAEVAGREARTSAQALMGSLPYMAPERFAKEAAGTWSDIYSLGCMFFEGLAHEPLFPEASPVDMARRAASPAEHAEYVAARLATLPDSLPHQAISLLEGMLAHDKEARPVAAEVSAACEAAADAASGPTLKRWCRHRSWSASYTNPGALTGRSLTEEHVAQLTPTGDLMAEERSTLDEFTTGNDASATFVDDPEARDYDQTYDFSQLATAESERAPAVVPSPSRGILMAGAGLLGAMVVGIAAVVGMGVLDTDPPLEPMVPAPVHLEAPDPEPVVEVEPPVVEPPVEAPPAVAPAPVADPGGTAEVHGAPTPEPTVAPRPALATTGPAITAPPVDPPPADITPPEPPPVPVVVPAPAPLAPPGLVRLSGEAVLELRGAPGTFSPGAVPPGTYEVWADFGSDFYPQGRAEVVSGGSLTIRCNSLRYSCDVEY